MQNYSLITGAAGLLGEYHAIEIGYVDSTDLDTHKLKDIQIKLNSKYNKNKILYYKMDVRRNR